MTGRQAAVAAAADLKWLTNSAGLLNHTLRYTAGEARWWGLIRLLVEELGLTLKAAADTATTALRTNSLSTVRVTDDPSDSATIVIDLPRYESIFLGNLSRALIHGTPRRRGRVRSTQKSAVSAASEYGIDISLLRSALRRTPAERLAMLEANAEFVRDMRGRPR